MTVPTVSVCIPAYRNAEALERALESLQAQEFKDFEVVISDDSPDDCVEQLVRRTELDVPVKYQRNSARLGSPANWDESVSLAQGHFVKLLHHDDWLTSESSLGQYVELMLRTPQADLGFGATLVTGVDGVVQRVHKATRRQVGAVELNPTLLFPVNIIGSPSATIYRRSRALRYDPMLKWVVDIDFYIRMLHGCPQLAFTAEPLVHTINGLPSQVTAECLDDKRVELFEWTYLYRKLFSDTGDDPTPLQVKFMWDLLRKHHVNSLDDYKHSIDGVQAPRLMRRMIAVREWLARHKLS